MSVVTELIVNEGNGCISFGNYELGAKKKLDNYEVGGNLYKVKTYCDITKLEKNGLFLYESVPGTAVHQFAMDETGVVFTVEAANDCQITLGLEENQENMVMVDDEDLGPMITNMGGKLSLSLEVESGVGRTVCVKK